MIYFERDKRYRKIKDVADEMGVERQTLYEGVRDMENYHLARYKKTAFGSYLIEDEEMRDLKEYVTMKGFGLSPRGTAESIKARKRNELEKNKNKKKHPNMEWAKGLNYAVWRNF